MTYQKFVAPVAAAALVFGLAACSSDDAKDDAAKATDTVASGAADASAAVSSVMQAPEGDKPAEGQPAEGDAGAELVDVQTAEGETVQVPAAIKAAAEQNPAVYNSLLSVKKGEKGEFLAEYPNREYLSFTAETGVQPVRGSISEVWLGQGGFESPLGAPGAEETFLPDEDGWSQIFTNGTIKWTKDEAGEYQADIQAK